MHKLVNNLKKSTIALSVAVTMPALLMFQSGTTNAAPAAKSLHGVMKHDAMWAQYKTRFIAPSGRVVDNANGNISHSEGQGFAMLMAVAADDPQTFAKLWHFTTKSLGVRNDHLFAWKWKPSLLNNVPDKNNATDGDILVAWALLEASKAGFGDAYRTSANAILKDVKKLVRSDKVFGRFILPAKFGFDAPHHHGKDIINISYWVFPAFERIAEITGDDSWRALAKSGEKLLKRATANSAGLPADWNTLKRNEGKIGYSHKFNSEFSYNAVRVPLYLAWSKTGSFKSLEAFQKRWVARSGKLSRVNVRSNRSGGYFEDQGYKAIAAIVGCSVSGQTFPQGLRQNLDKFYYPASLHMLSVIATKQRFPQCW